MDDSGRANAAADLSLSIWRTVYDRASRITHVFINPATPAILENSRTAPVTPIEYSDLGFRTGVDLKRVCLAH